MNARAKENRYVVSARTGSGTWLYLALDSGVWRWTDLYEEVTFFTDVETAKEEWNNIPPPKWDEPIDESSVALRKIVFHNVIPLPFTKEENTKAEETAPETETVAETDELVEPTDTENIQKDTPEEIAEVLQVDSQVQEGFKDDPEPEAPPGFDAEDVYEEEFLDETIDETVDNIPYRFIDPDEEDSIEGINFHISGAGGLSLSGFEQNKETESSEFDIKELTHKFVDFLEAFSNKSETAIQDAINSLRDELDPVKKVTLPTTPQAPTEKPVQSVPEQDEKEAEETMDAETTSEEEIADLPVQQVPSGRNDVLKKPIQSGGNTSSRRKKKKRRR